MQVELSTVSFVGTKLASSIADNESSNKDLEASQTSRNRFRPIIRKAPTRSRKEGHVLENITLDDLFRDEP